jgi:hypothetical protein
MWEASNLDNHIQLLMTQINKGWPNTPNNVQEELLQYWNYRAEFCVISEVIDIFKGDIEQICASCSTCMNFVSTPQKEPLLPFPTPSRPWEVLSSDLFNKLYGKKLFAHSWSLQQIRWSWTLD